MQSTTRSLLLWSPRILGILIALFLGMFALDSIGEGIVAFLIHLIPSFVLLAALGLAWRWEWLGGVVFLALAAAYAVWAREHVDWIILISGPLCVTGVLFLLGWRRHGELRASG